MKRPSILFVDDEPSVLGGLRRQLWDRRGDWDLRFAPGAAQALELLADQSADLVVSDMRMPGMDGAALLEAVRTRWPATVRILLTGYTDQEQSLRSARSAHQFLDKPCEAARLREALTQALALSALVADAGLRADLARLVALPMLGQVQAGIQAELDRGDASLKRLGSLVEHDAGLSAKLLQLVNSAALALPVRVSRPAQAVALLGLEHVRVLWLALGAFQNLKRARPSAAESAAFGHGEAVALAVRKALLSFGDDAAGAGFSAGLMHDVGAVALAACRPEAWDALDEAASLDDERAACGADHAQAGAFLLGLWGLPAPVVQAVARHHQEPDPGDPLQAALSRAERLNSTALAAA